MEILIPDDDALNSARVAESQAVSEDDKRLEISSLPLDDQFTILLHKKIMHKSGAARRQAKKYYTDKYKKTGVIPKPLRLAGQGILEGRKCSGRARALSERVKKRFVVMLRASSDAEDPRFIFITRKRRTIKNYHRWLEEEFGHSISLPALRRYVRRKNLGHYLNKPDFEDEDPVQSYFETQPVFDLIQVDGCVFECLKIKNDSGQWQKPQVIEFYDTGSRYMFVLDFYFSESSINSVQLFMRFLLDTPFPAKTICLRPDQAKGFLNLKRPIHELNLKFSMPSGFYMKPDFSRVSAPKDKAHLESSHRSLHNFEIRIIKKFQERIVKIKPEYTFKRGRKEQITVTYLDIDIEQLKQSSMLELYRNEHNKQIHHFSQEGKTMPWIPAEKLHSYLSAIETIEFMPPQVEDFIKYGFDKISATVSPKGKITYNHHRYYVAVGVEKFSRHQSTKVYISEVNDKLLIFEHKHDGVFLAEALPLKAPQKPKKSSQPKLPANEVEQIAEFLQNKGMLVDPVALIDRYRNGLTLTVAKDIFDSNKSRYEKYALKLNQSKQRLGLALFNAFLIDCQRYQRRTHVAPYASSGEQHK
jgi:hypothetical protein